MAADPESNGGLLSWGFFCMCVLSSSPSMLGSTACPHCGFLMGLQFMELIVFRAKDFLIWSLSHCAVIDAVCCQVRMGTLSGCGLPLSRPGNAVVLDVCVMRFVRDGFFISSFSDQWVNNVHSDTRPNPGLLKQRTFSSVLSQRNRQFKRRSLLSPLYFMRFGPFSD